MGHVLIDNRYALAADDLLTMATGKAEREAAHEMVKAVPDRRSKHPTMGTDKSYDTKDFVQKLRKLTVTPHVAQSTNGRSSAIDARTTRHAGYEVSQRKRKLVEQIFG